MIIDFTKMEWQRQNNRIEVKKVLGGLPNIFRVWRDQIWVMPASAGQLEPERNWDVVAENIAPNAWRNNVE